MNIKLSKPLFTLSFSISALLTVSCNSASAVTLDYAGRFGNEISCVIEGPPSNRRCSFEDLKGGSFSGFLEFDESGTLSRNIQSPRLNLFDKDGLQVNQQFFINAGISFNNDIANLSLQNFLGASYEEELTVKFLSPGITNVNEPFGAFINGNYRKREGRSFPIFQSINIVDANVKRRLVPEGSFVLGIFTCFGLSWLIKKQNVET